MRYFLHTLVNVGLGAMKYILTVYLGLLECSVHSALGYFLSIRSVLCLFVLRKLIVNDQFRISWCYQFQFIFLVDLLQFLFRITEIINMNPLVSDCGIGVVRWPLYYYCRYWEAKMNSKNQILQTFTGWKSTGKVDDKLGHNTKISPIYGLLGPNEDDEDKRMSHVHETIPENPHGSIDWTLQTE